MKVLVVHNFYQQPGGEDQVFASEVRMLEQAGHEVLRFTETNDRVGEMGRLRMAAATVWNREAYQRVYALAREERPDIVHFHNTFPLLSPACYYAARNAGAAVVQTLHNYRLLCPAATLLREGRPCEDCVGRAVAWPGVRHACYRGSRTASAGVATMLAVHHAAGTWNRAVDAYIALTEFSRNLFVAGGLPASRLFTKPNFMAPDPGVGSGGNFFLYAGRLSQEKGLDVLLDTWGLGSGLPPLKIIGDGPLGPWLRERIAGRVNVTWMGRLPHELVLEEMKNAKALILPSIWYENFPVSVVEAYATGLPVIASDAGTLPELVRDGDTGLIFQSGNADDLRSKVARLDSDPSFAHDLRRHARDAFERQFDRKRNVFLLLDIYRKARAIRNRET